MIEVESLLMIVQYQITSTCLFAPLRFLDHTIVITASGSIFVAAVLHALNLVGDKITDHYVFQHRMHKLRNLAFRMSIVVLGLILGLMLLLVAVLPDSIQACSNLV